MSEEIKYFSVCVVFQISRHT